MPQRERPHSESELVELFRSLFEPQDPPSDLLIGIGDDAAAIEPGCDIETKFVITTDLLVEGVHFDREVHSAYDIGWRAAAANLSDIAAMGAQPRWAVCALAAPSDTGVSWFEELAKGLRDALSEHEACVVGGDLSHSPGPVFVSVTLQGETTGRLLSRKGAQLGDYIAVTGSLGRSRAGLLLLQNRKIHMSPEKRDKLIQAHLRPRARVFAGQVFAGHEGIHAMMDISDGLGIDLARLCAASRVGARLREDVFPVDDDVTEAASLLGLDPLELASGGEDFELLVTGDKEALDYAATVLDRRNDPLHLTIIGEIIDSPFGMNLLRRDGSVIDPSGLGWDHFIRGKKKRGRT